VSTVTAETAQAPSRPWDVLAGGPFRALWAAHLLTLIGDAFSIVALPWLVLQMTGSGLALGTVLALEAIPRAALMLVGGAVADRVSPRLAMLGSAAVRAALIGLLALLVLTHAVQLWEVYVVALLVGAVSAFFLPARFAVLPSVVADQHLEAGNALLNLNQQASIFVGPALAGLLVAAAGPGPAFVVDAAAFAVASALLLAVPAAPRPAAAAASRVWGLLVEIREGLRYAWSEAGLRAVLLLVAAINFATTASMTVGLPVLAHQRFAQGAAALGSLLAAWGLGSTIGVVGAGLRRMPMRFGPLAILTVAWSGACVGLVGLAPSLPFALAAVAVGGLADGAINTYGLAWLQRRTADAVRGRVMSLVMMAAVGLAPVSLALAGLVAGHPTVLFTAAAAIMLASAGGAALSRTVRSLWPTGCGDEAVPAPAPGVPPSHVKNDERRCSCWCCQAWLTRPRPGPHGAARCASRSPPAWRLPALRAPPARCQPGRPRCRATR
jgi:MFS family permease